MIRARARERWLFGEAFVVSHGAAAGDAFRTRRRAGAVDRLRHTSYARFSLPLLPPPSSPRQRSALLLFIRTTGATLRGRGLDGRVSASSIRGCQACAHLTQRTDRHRRLPAALVTVRTYHRLSRDASIPRRKTAPTRYRSIARIRRRRAPVRTRV